MEQLYAAQAELFLFPLKRRINFISSWEPKAKSPRIDISEEKGKIFHLATAAANRYIGAHF